MQASFEKTYHEVEKDHWWFKARRDYIHTLLHAYAKDIKVLDIGCSSGLLLTELHAKGFNTNNLYGVDISPEAIKRCKENGIHHSFVMDAQQISLDTRFDVIIASDCLEHLQDDQKAIENWSNLLKPGGKLIVFVPAFMFLWSAHDVVNMHFRRYTKRELLGKVGINGLQIQQSGYWNFSLFVPVTLIRLLGRLLPAKGAEPSGNLYQMPSFVNSCLKSLLFIENSFLRVTRFPVGISTYCIAQKQL